MLIGKLQVFGHQRKAVVATVERSTVRKTLGSLSADDFAEIEQSVRVVLGL